MERSEFELPVPICEQLDDSLEVRVVHAVEKFVSIRNFVAVGEPDLDQPLAGVRRDNVGIARNFIRFQHDLLGRAADYGTFLIFTPNS